MPLFNFWLVQIGTYLIQISLNSRLHTLWSVNDVAARDPSETRRGLKAKLVLFPALSTSLRDSKDSLRLEIPRFGLFDENPPQRVPCWFPAGIQLVNY